MSNQDFPRDKRLLSPGDFQRVFQDPERLSSAQLLLLYKPNALGFARLGLAIAKKHAKRAVDRNRIKRRARETFRLAFAGLPGVDIVVLAKLGVAKADDASLHETLTKLWAKLAQRHKPSP